MSFQKSQLKFFAEYIEKELGIIYEERNFFQLEKRLDDIVRQMGVKDHAQLWEMAQNGIKGHFRQLLLDIATNNETSFFRDPKVFKMIEKDIIPGWRKQNPSSNLFRIWSVASSFGQEPYTLSMLANEARIKDPGFPRVEILATDISDKALERAKSGKYTQLEIQRGLPAPLMVKYFQKKEDDHWHVKAEIKLNVQFQKLNLLKIFGITGNFDLILCRNVLIYQREEKKAEIIKNLTHFLSNQGSLVLGAAESLMGISSGQYEQCMGQGATYYKRIDPHNTEKDESWRKPSAA